MAMFRTEVEAMFYDGSADSFQRLWEWVCPDNDTLKSPVHCDGPDDAPGAIYVDTPWREVKAEPGVWVVKNAAGQFFPYKPEVFEAVYTQEVAK